MRTGSPTYPPLTTAHSTTHRTKNLIHQPRDTSDSQTKPRTRNGAAVRTRCPCDTAVAATVTVAAPPATEVPAPAPAPAATATGALDLESEEKIPNNPLLLLSLASLLAGAVAAAAAT